MPHKTRLGLIGILGIWVTAGLALPFVNVLGMFTPTQLMTFRGFLTALIAFIGLRGVIGQVDKYTNLIAIVLPFATLGLFEGIRYWGAGPTIIIITATPLVNFALSPFFGRRISGASTVGLLLLLGGVTLASQGGHFQWEGLLWTVFGTVMNGVLYELFPRALPSLLEDSPQEKLRKKLVKCFYGCMGMGTLGSVMSLGESWTAIGEPGNIIMILGFAFVGGFLYWLSNIIAFDNLPTNEACVLAQGETPAVILGANLMLGEHLTSVRWFGVIVALFGASYLSYWLSKKSATSEAP